jgi:hypothetical protein
MICLHARVVPNHKLSSDLFVVAATNATSRASAAFGCEEGKWPSNAGDLRRREIQGYPSAVQALEMTKKVSILVAIGYSKSLEPGAS